MWLDILIIVVLMVFAILLGLAEIFLFPGITLAGIGGCLFAAGGLYLAYSISLTVGNALLGGSTLLFCTAFLWLLRARSFNRVALKTSIDSKLRADDELGIHPGDRGITLSRLAPVGKVRIGTLTVEARVQDELVDEQTPVRVVQVSKNEIIVAPLSHSNEYS